MYRKSQIQLRIISPRRQTSKNLHIDAFPSRRAFKALQVTVEKGEFLLASHTGLPGQRTHSHQCHVALNPLASATPQVSKLAQKFLITSKWVTLHYEVACNQNNVFKILTRSQCLDIRRLQSYTILPARDYNLPRNTFCFLRASLRAHFWKASPQSLLGAA